MARLGRGLLAASAMKPGLGVNPPTAKDEQSSIRSAPPATAACRPAGLSTHTSSKMPDMTAPIKTAPVSAARTCRSSAEFLGQALRLRSHNDLPAGGRGADRTAGRVPAQIRFRHLGRVLHIDQ